MAKLGKIDSNVTELRYCEEDSYNTVSGDEIWFQLEPNSYADFGGEVTLTPRNPINSSRQRKKGVITDLNAAGGFDNDLTQENLQRVLQGFFFADLRRKQDVGLYQSPAWAHVTGQNADFTITDIDTTSDTITVDSRVAVTAVIAAGGTGYADGDIVEVTDANATITCYFVVTGETGGVVDTVALQQGTTTIIYGRVGRTHTDTGVGAATVKQTGSGDDALTLTVTYGNGLTWAANDLLFLSGNNDAANDGLKSVASVADNVITVNENLTTDASPASTARMSRVGVVGAAGDIDVDATGTLPVLTSTALDFTTLGLIPGEWIHVGGDVAGTFFEDNTENTTFARIRSIAATVLTLDKTEATLVTEASTTETLHIYFGRVLKNETGTSIRRRTYQLERQLGAPDDALPAEVQAEYITGCVPGEFELKVPAADKAVASVSFVGADNQTISAATSLKAGPRPALVEADAFNTTSDIPRVKLSAVSNVDSNPDALFAFIEEMNITINENLTGEKAIGVLGNFEVTAGTFEVGGDMTAYFQDVAATAAVRANADITLDAHFVKDNQGMSWDMPLIALGNARLNVEQDAAIKLPLENSAATGAKVDPNLDHTLLMVFWDYLPDAAS